MSMRLPEPTALLDTLAMILPENCPLRAADPVDPAAAPGTAYGALLRDDTNEAVAAIVADTAATVYLGGNLIMIPPAGQEEQFRAGRAEDSVLDAMSEVINMLRSAINKIPGNPHVAPDPLRPLADLAAEHPWLAAPSNRLDLAGPVPFGDAHLALLVR